MTQGPEAITLQEHALGAAQRAYAPYSGLLVGAAAHIEGPTGENHIVTGCNVENVSYGLTLCAETVLVGNAVAERLLGDGGKLRSISVVNAAGEPLTPCGRCRQVLAEFADSETTILTAVGPKTIHELLPWAFGPQHLPEDTTT